MSEKSLGGAYNYKTLQCTNIPELFLDKFVARAHFGRFGNLVNFVLRPRRMTCTISYASDSEAALAMREGAVFNGHTFEINYAQIESTPAQKTEEWVDPDVQSELSALSTSWRSEYSVVRKASSSAVNSNVVKEREWEREKERRQELEAVMRKAAHSSEEKYRILDARDKWLRLNQRHGTTALDAKRLQGYCADMCPEKERVLREFQRQVAVYEMQPNSDELISHELAVKQYSRSSADQETPLPHELRSEPALHMTMSYLMHEIMDVSERQDAHLGDWFHFVWDRTRSIRKEITQQELCSLGAVKLVEQCARFHIHCAARLVAEDPSVFDSKINAENLTKCLQTLKYMYHDLRLKGIKCPREAEFRGYIVLLNLADANFLWDVGQLPVDLQNCPQIRRAIQFYLALQDTNFVRFFQLLQDPETSYLSACILISYFSQLRILALHRLVLAYRAPRKYEFSSLPVSFIRQMMHFSSDAEAAEFAEGCGLNVNQAERVELTRIHSPEPYKIRRQIELVESKRRHSVGECVCGEPLPPKSLYANHRPHNSFDEQGFLKSSAWTARDQLNRSMGQKEVKRAPAKTIANNVTTENQAAQIDLFKVPLFSAHIPPKVNAITGPPSSQQTRQLVHPHQPNQQSQQQQPSQKSKNFFDLGIFALNADNCTNNIFVTKHSTEKLAFHAIEQPPANATALPNQLRQENSAKNVKLSTLQQATTKQQNAELIEIQKTNQADSEIRQQRSLKQQQIEKEKQRQLLVRKEHERHEQATVAEAEIAAIAEKKRQQKECLELQLEERSQKLVFELIEQQVRRMCQQNWLLLQKSKILYHTLLDLQIAALVKKHLMRINYEQGLMRHYWQRWRIYRRSQQYKDKLFSLLPLNFCSVLPEQLVDAKELEQPLRLIRRYRQGESCEFRRLLAGIENQCSLKLDLWELLARILPKLPGDNQFFKLLISLPDDSLGLIVEHALDCGLLFRPAQSNMHKANQNQFYMHGLSNGVALCVYKLKGMPKDQLTQQLADADGIICFVASRQLKETQDRLHQICSRSGCSVVALIVQQQEDGVQVRQEQLVKQLNLGTLRTFRIYDFRLLPRGKQKTQLVALLQCAVQFLAKQSHLSRGLLQQVQLQEWLIYHLGDELFSRLRSAGHHDEAIQQSYSNSPHFCVQLYNDAVRRLQMVVGERLEELPKLPEELRCYVEPLETLTSGLPNRIEYFIDGWQLPEKRKQIVQLLEQVKLPDMLPLPSQSQLYKVCEWVINYAQRSSEESLVESLALRAMQILEVQLSSGNLNYIDIVEIFARERLQLVLRGPESDMPSSIVYRLITMQKYFQSHWYFEHQPEVAPRPTSNPVEKQTAAIVIPRPDRQTLIFDEVMHHAQTTLDKYQKKQVSFKDFAVFNEPHHEIKKLELTMKRLDPEFTFKFITKKTTQPKQAEDGQTVSANKRQRLSLPTNDAMTTLDRTESLLRARHSNEKRRRHILQRAEQIL